jgi:hypothetical protein
MASLTIYDDILIPVLVDCEWNQNAISLDGVSKLGHSFLREDQTRVVRVGLDLLDQ